jgi:Cu(I)/Ag(I) efflux system membrane protein CusA/SilA
MPIKARVDMQSTGIRTPVGVKVFANDLATLERMAGEVEAVVKAVPGTASAYAERISGGYQMQIEPDRMRLARYGITVGALQETIAAALGGETVTSTVEGRERYGVIVRYPRELRSDPQMIASQVLVPAANGSMVPLGQLASVGIAKGASSIRTENAMLAAYVYVDTRERDIGGYVERARRAVAEKVTFPPGSYVAWSGEFENMERANARFAVVVPIAALVIVALLYAYFRRMTETLIVMLSVPFSLAGGVWLMWLLDYHLSVATVVGLIALAGVAAETGVVMLLYLDHAWSALRDRCAAEGTLPTADDLLQAVMAGAVERVRPKMMTVTCIIAGLLPLMWSNGAGSEVMRRIAAPMVGGMVSSTLLTLLVIPAVYALIHQRRLTLPAP